MRVYIKHLHDEVGMRLKSYNVDGELGVPAIASRRGCASKVQNNYVQVFVGGTQLGWPTELQAMQKKDAATVATAVSNVMGEIIDVAAAATSYDYLGWRPLHYLVRDDSLSLYHSPLLFSVSTLPAACHRLLSR